MKKIFLFAAFLFISCFVFAQNKTISAKFKDAACNDAACECNACYYSFTTDSGEELVFKAIQKEYTDWPELLNEIDGGVQANPDFIGTRFEIQYSDETCQCMGFSETGNTVFEDVETKKILQIYIP